MTRDRRDFCGQPRILLEATGLTVYAWRLMPDHPYLLRRTGQQPPGRALFVQELPGIL